ncbi:uncharacterized protein NECHADRAFT_103661 [Fusarium vanettenii 77-13-4]|uniref:Mitochondrial genome maintenance protein MGM101 n=1 Tax=Fusarium vanettenii (strain ATCC MYA-4622 / CBS 123669 / FGSC 9596 / NRRL 45880 / 77-13-4) TaxID=660122 RepID=C7YLC8_FUSV7|nr:uncharacterized protein NECHADRAFT_103661 [Fusarium vanettenii 77-13-4]EEU47238.1 hypothetical protein NECHADRAFT_103661 [Fusarium vanettenii 77-13-4]
MTKEESQAQQKAEEEDDDEPDEWDKRIFSTGCAEENTKMTDCYFEKKDWRACASEVYILASPTPAITFTMFVPRRALFAAQRLPFARARPIADVTLQKPDEDVTQIAAPAKAGSTTSGPSNPYQPAPVAEKSLSESTPPKQEPLGSPRVWDGRHVDAPHEVDWEKSWFGIGSKPVTSEQNRVLARAINPDDVEVKPDGIVYLPEVKYRRRLNEAFGPMGWGMVNRGDVVVGTNIVTREYALIVNGRFVSQAQGVNNYFSAEGLPAAIEGCKSNALMRCCKDLGIASELWDPVFLRWFRKHYMEERWVEHVTTKKKRTFWYKKGLAEPVFPYKLV